MKRNPTKDVQVKHEIELQYKRLERDSEERKLVTLKARLRQKMQDLQQAPLLYRAS